MQDDEIYKYMPYRKEFFENFLLRISQKTALNDPFEIEPSLDWWADLCLQTKNDRFGNTRQEIRGYLKEHENTSGWRHLGTSLFKEEGVVSFTKNKKNILMWAHYADSHKGMLVTFDSSHDFFHTTFTNQSKLSVGKLRKVTYRTKRLHTLEDDMSSPFFHKSKSWKYEDEYRLLLGFGVSNIGLVEKRILEKNKKALEKNKKTLENDPELEKLEYEDYNKSLKKITSRLHNQMAESPNIMFMITVPKEVIKAVYFGIDMKEDEKIEIKKIIEKNDALKHIKLYNSYVDDNNYKIKYTPMRNDTNL